MHIARKKQKKPEKTHEKVLPMLKQILSSFLVSILISGCQSSVEKPIATLGQAKLGFSASPGWYPWQVANDLQLFNSYGVDVNLQWFDVYGDSIESLVTKKIDCNSQALGETIAAIAAGADLVVVLTTDNSAGNNKIVARQGVDTIKDLKGKTIALEIGTASHFLLLQVLESSDIKEHEVIIVPLNTGDAAKGFAAGKFDATATVAPFTLKALERSGAKELISSKKYPGAISGHLVCNRDFVERHPAIVQAIVDTWFAASKPSVLESEAAIKAMASRASVPEKDYGKLANGTKIFSIEENLNAVKLREDDSSSLPYMAETVTYFLREENFIGEKRLFGLSKIFDSRFINRKKYD